MSHGTVRQASDFDMLKFFQHEDIYVGRMSISRRERFVIAFGGLVLLVGFLTLTVAILAAPQIGLASFEVLFQDSELTVLILLVLGVLDLAGGILLALRS